MPWTWLDLLILFFFGLGSLYVVQVVALNLVVLRTGLAPLAIQKNVEAQSIVLILSQVLWSLVILSYMVAVVALRFQRPFWSTVGWRKFRIGELSQGGACLLCALGGMMLSIGILVVSALVRTPTKLPIEGLYQSPRSAALVMAMAVLVAPLVEETIFRGYIFPVAARSLGTGGGVAFTGTLFGLMHAQQLWGGWGQIALLVLVGIVLTRVRASTGSVLASYCCHLGYNSFLFLGFFFSGGFRHLPGSP